MRYPIKPLYHFTCGDHGKPAIERTMTLRPNPTGLMPTPVVWLTDIETPTREQTGLTSTIISCDRTEYRAVVTNTKSVMWWPDYCRKRRVNLSLRAMLEHGCDPEHWWVCEKPLTVDAIEATAVTR